MSALGRRYAKAALEACTDSAGGDANLAANRSDALAADMQRFIAAYRQSDVLQALVRNPVLQDRRAAVLEAVLTKLELGPVGHKLIALLAKNGRMDQVENVADEVAALVDMQLGRLRAHVRAAVLPDAAQTQRIAETLQRRLGKPVLVTVSAAPELLAGLVCQVGDLTFDSSLKRQLAILTERLGAHGAAS
jgi:F-type H+-transporting ATPase subunit delta